jgi:predicted Zn-dependent protease
LPPAGVDFAACNHYFYKQIAAGGPTAGTVHERSRDAGCGPVLSRNLNPAITFAAVTDPQAEAVTGPEAERRSVVIQMKTYYHILILFTIFVASCATSPTGRRQFIIVSEDAAIAASKQAYTQMLEPYSQQGKIDNNPALKDRVYRITGRLIAQAIKIRPETGNWEWRIKIIDDPETVNAWAMAGGKMALYTGLVEKVKPTDDELAQVLGHEISHALAKHSAEKMSIAMASSIGVAAVGIAADQKGLAMTGAALAATLAVQMPNSRAAESEADRIGIELAAKAGYDPRAAITLWQKMAKVGGKGPPEFLSTHPAPENREKKLAALIPEMMPYYEQKGERPFYKL